MTEASSTKKVWRNNMIIKTIVDEDFTNYKKPSMLIGAPRCTMKCGEALCQNSPLLKEPDINIDDDKLIKRYLDNSLTHAVVFGGLDGFDTPNELFSFIDKFRKVSNDDIVIYTGYNEWEIKFEIDMLRIYPNIIVKFGRYIPNQQPHYDEVLGVELASDNQYAERIS